VSRLVIPLGGSGVERLEALQERLGLRSSAVVSTALRVCRMAHGCGGSPPIYQRDVSGEFVRLYLRRCRPLDIDQDDVQLVGLALPRRELVKFRRCTKIAGDSQLGIETALWVLERLSSPQAPRLFEKRGSEYYPLFVK